MSAILGDARILFLRSDNNLWKLTAALSLAALLVQVLLNLRRRASRARDA